MGILRMEQEKYT